MRKILTLLTMVIMLGGMANAAIINVTKANYIVTQVFVAKHAFGADLEQNHARHTRTEIRLNKNVHCYIVHRGGGPDTPVGTNAFLNSLHRGTRVRVTGGRSWDNKINASDVWAEN